MGDIGSRMRRLFLFTAITLIALFVVVTLYGQGDPRGDILAADDRPAAGAAQDSGGLAALLPDLTPDPPATGAHATPPADLVQAATQTPERVHRFPGPPLRPSPEHAGKPRQPDPAPLPKSPAGPILYVTGDRVNVRAGPSTGNPVIGALTGGSAVEALEPEQGGWVHIRDAEGRSGYLSARFLSPDRP